MIRVYALLLILGAAFTIGACEPADESEVTARVSAVPVETIELAPKGFVEKVEVTGVTEPIHEVRVAAEAPGRVLRAPFEEGKQIKRGELLLRVDTRLDSARVDVLESQVKSARREYERTKMLAKEGLATPQQLDQAESAVENAQLNLKQARVGIGKSTIRSPIAGHVATKFVEKGEYVSPGMPLAHIVDYDTIVVNASVPEGNIANVKEGAEVDIWLPSLDRQVSGVVERRSITASEKTRTFPVEIHVDNPDREILPGMRARVIIPRRTWESVIVVPRDAILQGFENQEAMVVEKEDGESVARIRNVQTGPARGNSIVITEGLEAGEQLIVKGHRSIVDGTRVKIVSTGESAEHEPQAAPAKEIDRPDAREEAGLDEETEKSELAGTKASP